MQTIYRQIYQQKWAILFWILISLVTFLLLIELPPKPQTIPYLDKFQHAFIFIILYLFAAMAWKPHKYWLAAALILYGATTELLQGMLTITRLASTNDWLADVAGIFIGLLLFIIYEKIVAK
jgi:VanZ family protein